MDNLSYFYRSLDDLSMRHRDTYIGLRDPQRDLIQPHYVEAVGGSVSDDDVTFVCGSVRINSSDPNLVIKRPVPCMVNHSCSITRKNVALWYESRAVRGIKRSLNFSSISSDIVASSLFTRYARPSVSVSNATGRQKAAFTFWNHDFPSLEEALLEVSEGRAFSIAFDPKFALAPHKDYGIVLMYKKDIVGYMNGSTPVLLEEFQYLIEQLEVYRNATA